MKTLRVLIVEDEPLIAMDLENFVTEIVPAVAIARSSVAGAKQVLVETLDFAFLDVDVTNGKTYEIAYLLGASGCRSCSSPHRRRAIRP